MTTDDAAAEAFYKKVVGWTAQDMSQGDMKYTALLAGDAPVAGLMTLPKDACDAGARPGWIGYVGVDDVDATVGRVTKAGGKSPRPADRHPQCRPLRHGRRSAGHGVLPLQALRRHVRARPPIRPSPASSAGTSFMAVDGEKAFGFYADLFGWTKAEAMDMGAMGVYQLFAAGGAPIGGMMTKPPGVPVSFWNYYFQVDGIGAAMERLKAAGGSVINGPMEVPGGNWIVQGLDPQGAMFSLLSPHA